MNLIYLHTHDTGRYLQPYGCQVPTPRLQALADQSALFRNNYCCGPTCSPSRSAMLTGRYPHNCGMMGLAHRGFSIDYEQHLARFLRRNGYETVLCGMQHEAARAEDVGYDRVYSHDKAACKHATEWDEANGASAMAFLRERHDKPFFLSYGLEHTHRPFTEFDADIRQEGVRPPAPLPDTAETREDFVGFATSARRADQCIGRVLDEIDRLGLGDDTVVLYTTDHGIAFPWMKCTLYDTGIGTAMMLRYPGNPAAGKAIDALTSHIDVFPTLCDLLGISKPDWLQGVSLRPLLEGTAPAVREQIFAEVVYHASYEPQLAVRTDRYKYIRRMNPEHTTPALANVDNSPSKDYLMAHGLRDMQLEQEMLYDLVMDPNERRNLVTDPAYASVRTEMAGRLDIWMRDTAHPLLNGPVQLPKGAFVNTLTCEDPESTAPGDVYRQA